MRTLSQYEVAWNMYQAESKINLICQVVHKDRSTVYRWLKKIKRVGIRKFIQYQQACKQRRPKARTPEYVVQKIVDIRNEFGWCGAKIKKELKENHSINIGLSTIYRWLHRRFTKAIVSVKRYKKHKAIVTATKPREVIEHDTVDLGGKQANVYAYTAIDIFTKEPSIYIASDLEMTTGAIAFKFQKQYFGSVVIHQSDNGSEFQSLFVDAVEASGATHRYSRPYKKNEQSHIENFNKALRSECFPRGEYEVKDISKLQQRADEFTKHYIERRWHMGLPNMMTPRQFKDFYSMNPEAATLALAEVYKKSHLV